MATGPADKPANIAFVSLGMVVLDELRLPDGHVLYDTVGGSGAYSTLGARLVTDQTRSKEIGCFVLAGDDFPADIAAQLRSWDISLKIDVDEGRRSTRGLLQYHDEAFGRKYDGMVNLVALSIDGVAADKSFRYVTTPLQPAPSHLPSDFLLSQSFHMLLSPDEVVPYITELGALRQQHGTGKRPLIVWEPLPGRCKQEYFDDHVEACRSVDVFSPNHLELLALSGEPTESFARVCIEACVARFLTSDSSRAMKVVVIVRAGEHGCLVYGQHAREWLPPFFADGDEVVDATGGGNTFLGAFTLALQRSGDCVEAAIQAAVAASFSIEQIGLARRTSDDEEQELWNGARVCQRLQQYREKLEGQIPD